MNNLRKRGGFSLVETIVAVSIFVIFATGIYGAIVFVSKIVYQSRMTILETAVLSEELEVVRNLPYQSIGIVSGVPSGVLVRNKSVNRDGAQFSIVTTVRNIDDPFDGMATGTIPVDTSPADFKLVEMSAICDTCGQKSPIILSTTIGPKGLEGSTKNGALFINVFDEAGQPVVGANVRVVNGQANPKVIIDDVTDDSGYLRIVDTVTGTASYAITVSKPGYSTDYTVTSTVANPAPIKPPSNVVSQQVTDISFSIDQLSSMVVHTVNQLCAAVPNIGFNLKGAKLLGTDPVVYKYSTNFTTDGSGNKNLGSLEWDLYNMTLTGNVYDIAGSIPIEPTYLVPGSSQDVTLVLKAHSNNSLRVKVIDAATKLPLSNISARLTGPGAYDNTILTGLGYTRQTNWSLGSGSASFTEGRYFLDDGNVSGTAVPGDMLLRKSGNRYIANGWFESGTFDLGTTVNFNNVIFKPVTQPVQAGSRSVLAQIATSNSSSPVSWKYVGPDGTNSSFYSITSTIIAATSSGKRYVRYLVYLHTDNTSYTPNFSEMAFTYTNSCVPPGQSFFDSLSSGTYTLQLSGTGYVPSTTTIDVAGSTDVLVPMAEQ